MSDRKKINDMKETGTIVGLTDEEVLSSRSKHGENVLTPPEKASLWSQFIEKFKDPIIRILLVALLLSFGVSIYQMTAEGESATALLEPFGILIAVLLATLVGFFFEVSANRKFDILNQVNNDVPVQVIRNGHLTEIPKRDVVVGDIVSLNTGDEIPADGELLESVSLQVNESTLTGEPIVAKTTVEADFDSEATYPSNHVMNGTTVVDGHGLMQVTQVGDATEYGKVYEGSQIDNHTQTPLDRQLERLAGIISKASYIIAAIVVVARMTIYFLGDNPTDWIHLGSYSLSTLMIAVTLIVVAVPEGLPMSVTLSLAMSMKRMLATNNLVRKMHACETLGATSVICTDKTGTLTQNQMQIYRTNFWKLGDASLTESVSGRMIAEAIAVNSTANLDIDESGKARVLGNPTEGALLLWLRKQELEYMALRAEVPVVAQLTFSTERKYMATVVDSPAAGKRTLYVKGAPEILMSVCDVVETDKGDLPIADCRSEIESLLLTYQNQAMRTLGFAYAEADDSLPYFVDGRINPAIRLRMIGIAAISDPVRADVPAAIRSCIDAGIAIKIVTGDTPGTATEIGRQIGLWKPEDTELNRITGTEFAALSDEELLKRLPGLKIISRARPMDKERLVRLLQQLGNVVAVTGDGTNDAPALNKADVGLSMGDGTSVAKEASDVTILDNSFSSISCAVMWGRSLYQNIRRFIVFQMTINVVACLVVMLGAFLGTEAPLTVTQMLWVNLIMDTFAALALASLPPEEKVMRDRPRKITDHIISRAMSVRIFGVGLVFILALFGLLQYFKHYDITSLAQFDVLDFFGSFFDFTTVSQGLSPYELSMFFTIFVMLQFWNMFNAKVFGSGRSAFAGLFKSKGFLTTLCIILFGQILIVSFGGTMFSVVPLSIADWVYIVASTSVVLWVGEFFRLCKWLFRDRSK